MARLIRDYVEIGDHTSIEQLMTRLTEILDGLPSDAEAELKVRGDDVFGRHLCIAFMRPMTDEEAACEGRYADAGQRRLQEAA